MERPEYCPAKEFSCEKCVALASVTCRDALQEGGIAPDHAAILVENGKLPLLVDEVRGVDGLPCDARQERAYQIGKDAARTMLEK